MNLTGGNSFLFLHFFFSFLNPFVFFIYHILLSTFVSAHELSRAKKEEEDVLELNVVLPLSSLIIITDETCAFIQLPFSRNFTEG